MISLPRAKFQSLVGKLKSHKPCGMAKKEKRKRKRKGEEWDQISRGKNDDDMPIKEGENQLDENWAPCLCQVTGKIRKEG